MQSSNIPSVFNIPWANSAVAPYTHTVPEASQIAITPGAASLTDGFVPVNFLSPLAGGVPPFGNDMNGILNQITAWLRWGQAGGPVRYSSTFQTAIAGYPLGAIVQSATVTGKLWCSTTEGNVTNPDTGGAGWIPVMNTVYAPLTGVGASGTWGINISGVAATAATAAAVTNGGVLNTPASGVLTNCTGMAAGLSIGGNAATSTSATTAISATNATNATGSSVVNGSAGIGYAAGIGVEVTQLTSKGTNVYIGHKLCGRINTHNAALAAGATVYFTVTYGLAYGDNFITPYDTIIGTLSGSYASSGYDLKIVGGGGGDFTVFLKNNTSGSLSESVAINFAILRAINS